MKQYVTAGLAVLVGAALIETALIPGLVIGGAAVLAPNYLPKLRRRLLPLFNSAAQPQSEPRTARVRAPDVKPASTALVRLRVGRAVAKTITFRLIVTTLDFTTNYIVIGDLATAVGLSAYNLVVGPVFYLGHETAWNYFGPTEDSIELRRILRVAPNAQGVVVSRAVAKTITFRIIATVADFTANYVVVGDIVTAVGLSAFAFAVGPFVYLGHEKLWEHYSPTNRVESNLRLPGPSAEQESIMPLSQAEQPC